MRRPTPTLEQFGRDLTGEASAGRLSPVVSREVEIQAVIETLCRRTKRNPVLIGPRFSNFRRTLDVVIGRPASAPVDD